MTGIPYAPYENYAIVVQGRTLAHLFEVIEQGRFHENCLECAKITKACATAEFHSLGDPRGVA